MLRSKYAITLFVLLISFTASFSTLAMKPIMQITTPTPAPKEPIVVPNGYISCFTVSAGWYQDVWYPKRRVCQYDLSAITSSATNNMVQGNAWVESYWACTKYKTQGPAFGQCTTWEWRPGHWAKSLAIY